MTPASRRRPWTERHLTTPLLRLLVGRFGLDSDGIRVLEVPGRQLLADADTRAHQHPLFQLQANPWTRPSRRSPHMATQQLVQPHPTSNLQPDREGLRPGGWLLVAGALVSLGAGATPSMYAIYPSQTPQQFLRLVADRSGTWVGVHLAFLAGAVLTTLGLAALTSTLANSRGRALATIGLAVFIALTGIGLACYGAALLASRRLARWLGWTFVASGLLLALSVIVFGDGPPEAVELPLLLGGILALRQPRR